MFRAQGVDNALLQKWLAEDRAARGDSSVDAGERGTQAPTHQALRQLRVTKEHIRRAIATSKNTSPGPDGVPYKIGRAVGGIAVAVLQEALKDLSSPTAEHQLQQDMPDFNMSLLTFLPQKAAGCTEEGEDDFLPSGVRPLNITNTDNRILASAVRIALEPLLAPLITQDQKGFLTGRSMVANLLDIDEAMLQGPATGDGAYAIVFDFAAAFPSIA